MTQLPDPRASDASPRVPERPGTARLSVALTLLLCLPIGFSGCVSSGPPQRSKPSAPVRIDSPITEINLLAIPVTLNLDETAGTDGFVIKVYAGNPQHPKPVPIPGGTLEILMYDGVSHGPAAKPNLPRKIWTFEARDLAPLKVESSIGIGYDLTLLWGDAKPLRDKISIVARYVSPKGSTLYSAPSVISVVSR